MSASARRTTGMLIAAVLVLATAGLSVWRLRVAHQRGWAGFSFIPQKPETSTKPVPQLPFGWRLGTAILVLPGSPADRAGIAAGDFIDAVDGVPTTNYAALEKNDARVHRGDVVVYRVRRGAVARDVPLRLESPALSSVFLPSLIVSVLVSLVFLVVGTFIFWRGPSDQRAAVFFAMCVMAAIYFVNSAVSATENGSLRGMATTQTAGMLPQVALYVAAAFVFTPLLLHLALIFPKPRPVFERRPEVLRWVYGPPAVLFNGLLLLSTAGWALTKHLHSLSLGVLIAGALIVAAAAVRLGIAVWRRRAAAFRTEVLTTLIVAAGLLGCVFVLTTWTTPSLSAQLIVAGIAIGVLLISFLLYPVVTVITLYRTYRDSGIEEKQQVKWPLWAAVVVLAVKIVCGGLVSAVFLGGFLSSHSPTATVPMRVLEILPRLFYALIPLAFAFAIVKYRLMNIDLIIRRTLTYAMLSVIVFLAYGVLVAGVGTLLVKFAGVQNQAMVIASTIVVALVAVPLRNTLQRVVDRNVFRERVSYPLALRTLADAVSGGAGREELLRLLAEQLQQALQNRMVLVAMRSEQHFVAAAKVGVADEVLGSFRVPLFAITRPFEPADERLRRLGAALVVPMRAQREPIGFVALGAKLSNDPFSADDVEFLDAATSQVAMALETSRLRSEEVDFEQARAMQQILLPKSLPRPEGFEISGMWQPARSVGGDYYDAIALGDGKTGICIADVAGKGMPAALLMASLQAAVKATASADTAPARLCEKVRHVVASNLTGGTFITFFYALLDPGARTLTYCNAGHNPPLLVRATGEVERLDAGGSVLGRLFRAEGYCEATATLGPGDRVVLFTDGVSEARRGDEDFGDERLIDVVRAHRELGAAELQEKIVEAITSFTSGSFGDDVTLVVIGAS